MLHPINYKNIWIIYQMVNLYIVIVMINLIHHIMVNNSQMVELILIYCLINVIVIMIDSLNLSTFLKKILYLYTFVFVFLSKIKNKNLKFI